MSRVPSDLAGTVKALRPFVPAKDFEISKRFYADIGFAVEPLDDSIAAMHIGSHSFLLQNYYVKEWADNFVMHMFVDDLDAWWQHLAALNVASRYGVKSPRAPKLQSWGLTVAFMFDPAGVLWHIAAVPAKT
ncbi:MAG TPA: VOC family protein [Xanthobacteraceae bacterium]|nr:VOC family protein [Xanthobacteraceae bacterium]